MNTLGTEIKQKSATILDNSRNGDGYTDITFSLGGKISRIFLEFHSPFPIDPTFYSYCPGCPRG
jgi:hypothetical protein